MCYHHRSIHQVQASLLWNPQGSIQAAFNDELIRSSLYTTCSRHLIRMQIHNWNIKSLPVRLCRLHSLQALQLDSVHMHALNDIHLCYKLLTTNDCRACMCSKSLINNILLHLTLITNFKRSEATARQSNSVFSSDHGQLSIMQPLV